MKVNSVMNLFLHIPCLLTIAGGVRVNAFAFHGTPALGTRNSVTDRKGFASSSSTKSSTPARRSRSLSTQLYGDTLTSRVEEVIKEDYPIFHELMLSKNPEVWKALSDASTRSGPATLDEDTAAPAPGFCIFAPNDDAMRALGDTRLAQLGDVRNGETAEKMAAFHAVDEVVTVEELYNSGGVMTIGGVVDVGRTVTGGFMGIGGKEDGGTSVNGAKVLKSVEITCEYTGAFALIHETDGLISPEILWRYCDQLRIPGSK